MFYKLGPGLNRSQNLKQWIMSSMKHASKNSTKKINGEKANINWKIFCDEKL